MGDSDRTFCMYVNHDSLTGHQIYLDTGTATSKERFSTYKKSDNTFCVTDESAGYCTSTTLSVNTDYDLCAVYDSSDSELRFYIDGVSDYNVTVSDMKTAKGSQNNIAVQEGCSWCNEMNGKLDEIMITATAWTGEQIHDRS